MKNAIPQSHPATPRHPIATAFRIALAIVLLALVALPVLWHFNFNPSPPRANYPAPHDALEAQRQDLDYFAKLIALDRAFTPDARQQAAAQLETLRALDHPLDPPHLRVALMQIVALADNGHSSMSRGDGRVDELPVRVAPFADGIYILRAKDAFADLLGARVLAIDGTDIDRVMSRLATLHGGVPQWRRLYASIDLTTQDILFGAGIAHEPHAATWTVLARNGAQITRRIDAYQPDPAEPRPFVKRWYSSEPLRNESNASLTTGWQTYSPPQQPITLQDFDSFFRLVRLPGSCVALVQIKSNTDEGSQHIHDFLTDTERRLRADPPCSLILDLRFNNGGDYTNTYSFARDLPELIAPAGRIVTLIGPDTFSAGITTTAFVKQAAGARDTLLGEPVGDRLAFFSEGNHGTLPNLKANVNYMRGRHDYQHPCTDLRVCFWLNYYFSVRVANLDPDETIPLTFADWNLGRDLVFERALALTAPSH